MSTHHCKLKFTHSFHFIHEILISLIYCWASKNIRFLSPHLVAAYLTAALKTSFFCVALFMRMNMLTLANFECYGTFAWIETSELGSPFDLIFYICFFDKFVLDFDLNKPECAPKQHIYAIFFIVICLWYFAFRWSTIYFCCLAVRCAVISYKLFLLP